MAYPGEVIVFEGLEALRINPAGEERLGRNPKR